jgi:hypothetical protein
MNGMIELTTFFIILTIALIIFYIVKEKKKRKDIKTKFKKFSENYEQSQKKLRTVPRIRIPDSMEVKITILDDSFLRLKGHVIDMSLSGLLVKVKTDFTLKRIPLNTIIKHMQVITPINTFTITELKSVRIDYQVEKRLMAFHIEKIDPEQFEFLKTFITYLDNFLKNEK